MRAAPPWPSSSSATNRRRRANQISHLWDISEGTVTEDHRVKTFSQSLQTGDRPIIFDPQRLLSLQNKEPETARQRGSTRGTGPSRKPWGGSHKAENSQKNSDVTAQDKKHERFREKENERLTSELSVFTQKNKQNCEPCLLITHFDSRDEAGRLTNNERITTRSHFEF